MSPQLLILSAKQHDIDFWQRLGERENLLVKVTVQKDEISKLLEESPESIVLWDCENVELKGLDQLFNDLKIGQRVFVVTDNPIKNHPQFSTQQTFVHYLYRRYDKNAEVICASLLQRSKEKSTAGFENCFFSNILASKKVVLSHTNQKMQIVRDFQEMMVKHGIPERISEVGADAVDELVMNAIFNAPKNDSGVHYRRMTDRSLDFELEGKEQIEAELVITKDLIGIRVTDQFGSLNTEKTLNCIGKGFVISDYQAPDDNAGGGLGMLKMMKSATSLAYFVSPGISTESIALIGNARNFRELRNSFCFFSIQSESDH